MSYPNGSDLYNFLRAAGLITSDQAELKALLELDDIMLGSVQEFERLTRRTPFLNATSTISAKSFRVESTIVNFTNTPGLVSLDSGADAISSQGTNYTVGSNVQLLPLDNPAQGRPYTYLKFGGVNSGLPEEWNGFLGGSPSFLVAGGSGWMINVRGVWGYCTSLPYDVKRALICHGAHEVAPMLEHSLTGGVSEYREEDEVKKFAGNPFGSQMQTWLTKFHHAVQRYRASY